MHERNSNIELLRIFAMIGIILYHNFTWGGYTFDSVSTNYILLDSLSMFGKIGVNVFVIIT